MCCKCLAYGHGANHLSQDYCCSIESVSTHTSVRIGRDCFRGFYACQISLRLVESLHLVQGTGAEGVRALVEERGLLQISDPAALQAIVDAVLEASPKQLEQYRGGKTKLQGYFVG